MSSAFLLHFKCNFFAYSPFSWLTSIYCVYILLRALTFLAVLSFERNLNHFAQCSFIHIINFPLFPASLAYSSFGQKTSTTDGLARRCLQFFLRVFGRFSSPCTFSLFRFYPPPPALVSFCVCLRFVFLHLLFMPLQWYFCRLYQIFKLKDLRPQLQQFSLHFPPRSTCISIYFPRACFLGFHSTLDASVNWQRPELHLCHLGVPLLRPKKKNSICYLIVAVVAVIAPQSAGFDPLWAKLVS